MGRGVSPVVPEGELVEIVVELLRLDGSFVSGQQPTLE